MTLTLAWILPLVGAIALAAFPRWSEARARQWAAMMAALSLLALVIAWIGFDPAGPLFQHVVELRWVPSLGVAYRVGVDGIALAVATMSALLFVAAIVYPVDTLGQPRQYYAWLLFLEAVSLGVFLTLDLLLFYVFFDLSLVGMFFLIGRWGHGTPQVSALKFFLYTFAGSLLLLLAIIGLYLSVEPHSFDMRVLIEQQPLAGTGLYAGLVFLALMLGLAIKTPLVPLHTWLPQAHVDAPGPASAILAGVLLKMGTYGMVRLPFAMMQETFADHSLTVGIVALVAILYGALVALGQSNLKRRIAYTSINHMGYTVLGIAVAAAMFSDNLAARQLALTGATVEMVAHGLITGALFLICGSFWQRNGDYALDHYGGLAHRAPLLTGFTVLAAFASLGMPGLAGFVAEFQVFAGTFAVYPWLTVLGVLGILITAALFLDLLRRLFFGRLPSHLGGFKDLARAEWGVLAVLSAGILVIGISPRFLLTLIEASNALLLGGR
ncbi:NADH-quinone oxidoreductase subunit M [Halomonas sp. KAO]|uniref:complex I subunit 4 family protein n=1 Tax=unclassified Halomonas TaxID=2609666 RepID=UPI00189D4B9B|nr:MULTISPECIES: NADH-quinone oxidoreductase subunit M [unclassified Halomonas]MBF7054358.1 NADH-quinone oxidoreductase subunit M [Halomonas sp. KAO]MDT0499893.1 NADH-quinone oxidoreductase subunit M [Halomonas sp. PAR7]MDT0512298.1 NADH-quinone oxidoreductase subunit M [Halomonas sp. LES1]MDT0590931.1 NADH-quinone oxidoreductase subunit M [Halomonas sp. PAR8]